jgi:hypothetical protein
MKIHSYIQLVAMNLMPDFEHFWLHNKEERAILFRRLKTFELHFN